MPGRQIDNLPVALLSARGHKLLSQLSGLTLNPSRGFTRYPLTSSVITLPDDISF
jgi:hypothetical protein